MAQKTYTLNFGPHHPSTHGVLRLILEMDGERVVSCDPEIGYLHRGVEKICESKKLLSIIPYVDRLDYLAPLIAEHAYITAIEKANDIVPPKRAVFIRTIFDELTRISSHIMALGTATYDIGCLSLLLYGFEEREKIMEIFENVTGARMHPSFYVPGGVLSDLSDEAASQIKTFLSGLDFFLDAVNKLALKNRIFQKRNKEIGVVSKETAIKSGISGVSLRASGINFDIRALGTYGAYDQIGFSPIVLEEGDCFARNELRFMEIKQSAKIIQRCLDKMPKGEFSTFEYFQNKPKFGTLQEILYNHFFTTGLSLKSNTKIYTSTESPRGEFGVHILNSKLSNKPERIHFKSPSFALIQLMKQILNGTTIADITAIIGSLDFIMGDCDR